MPKELTLTDSKLKAIEDIKAGVGDLVVRMAHCVVKAQEDYDQAVVLGKEGNQVLKSLKAEKDRLLAEPKKFIEKVTASVKAISTPIESAVEDLRQECAAFIQREDAKRQKKEAELLRKKQEAEAKAEQADTAKEQEKALAQAERLETQAETVAASRVDNSTTRRVVEVVDEKLIPREYLSVDMKKLNNVKGAVGSQVPNIPGVKIYDQKGVVFG